jgi:hypothetical protein
MKAAVLAVVVAAVIQSLPDIKRYLEFALCDGTARWKR